MFWRILKKDLKRKKTMNIILLLFVILCAMFASAAVNNIIAVTGGIDYYFRTADVPDLVVNMLTDETDAEAKIRAQSSVSSVKSDHVLSVISSKNFSFQGKELENFFNPAGLISDSEMAINYFDEENHYHSFRSRKSTILTISIPLSLPDASGSRQTTYL